MSKHGTNDVPTLVQAAQKEVLESYRREFDQLNSTFRDLDSKAQGIATIAGVFLASSLAVANRPISPGQFWAKAILSFAVLGLIASISFAIQALRLRKVRSCPSGDDLAGLLNSLRSVTDEAELAERLLYFYGDAADLWRACVLERRATNKVKARFIWLGQIGLFLVAFSMAILLLMNLSG